MRRWVRICCDVFKVLEDEFRGLSDLPGLRTAPYLASSDFCGFAAQRPCARSATTIEANIRQSYAMILGGDPEKNKEAVRARLTATSLLPNSRGPCAESKIK